MAGVAPARTQRQAKTRDERVRTELESVVAGADGMDARAAKAARAPGGAGRAADLADYAADGFA